MSEEKRPAIAPLLRELQRELEPDDGESMPIGARNRVEFAIREHARGRRAERGIGRWLPAATFVAGASVVFAVVGFGARTPQAPPPLEAPAEVVVAAAPTPALGVFALEGDGCQGTPGDAQTTLRGNCRLVSDRLSAQVWGDAELAEDSGALAVRGGQLLFDVAPVAPGDPKVRIGVSHGTIEVIGTKFVVNQGDDGGYVDLFEGEIRFVEPGGRVVELSPGQRHEWGAAALLAEAADDPDPIEIILEEDESDAAFEAEEPSPRRRRRRRSQRDRSARAAEIIGHVGVLRAQRKYRAAVVELRAALRERWDRRTAEVLSYELGELLHRHLGERQAACDHLRQHQERFENGRYDTAIERTRAKLQCE